ncbi:15879_t:CDS:2, partial [Dentiscutata heterogama]
FKLSPCKVLSTVLLDQEYKDINIIVQHLFNQTQYFSLITDIATKEQYYTVDNIVLNIEKIMLEVGINKFIAIYNY